MSHADQDREAAARQLIHSQLGPLTSVLDDPQVTEIMINPGAVFVIQRGQHRALDVSLTPAMVETALIAIGNLAGCDPVCGRPSASMTAQFGAWRCTGALSSVSPSGPFLRIRKHGIHRLSMAELIGHGMLDGEQARLLQNAFIDQGQSLLIAGATNSGKTTLLNALLGTLPDHEVVVTVEDTPELQIVAPNRIGLIATPGNGQTIRQLVALSKRLSPTCLVLGEIRGVGGDAYDLLMALTSGHRGAATLHAGSARQALASLELMFHQSLPSNAQIPAPVVKQFIAKAIPLVAYVEAVPDFDGEGQLVHRRRLAQVALVTGIDNDDYALQYLVNDGHSVDQQPAGVRYAFVA